MSVFFRSLKDGWLLLSEKGSRWRMILASVLPCLGFVLPMIFGVYLPSAAVPLSLRGLDALNEYMRAEGQAELVLLLDEAELSLLSDIAVYVLTSVLGLLVTLPACAYFFTYTWQVYSRTRYGFVDRMRQKKGSYNYFRALLSSAVMLFGFMICFILLQGAYLSARLLSEALVFDGLAVPMIVFLVPFFAVTLVLCVFIIWLSGSFFFAPYYYARGMTLRAALRESRRTAARAPFSCDIFLLIFGAMAALSLLSVGVLFVLLVMPLMMFTYYSLAEHIDGKKLLED